MKKLIAPLLLACAAMAISAPEASAVGVKPEFDLTKYVWRGQGSRSAFNDNRARLIEKNNQTVMSHAMRAQENAYKPTSQFPLSQHMGDIDGPNGETWYYTMTLENDSIVHEYFIEYILKHFEINIFDAERQHVGTISDDIHYTEGESRTPYCDMLPVVTQKFFNQDDKYEIAVGMAINWQPGINHYYTHVYQLDGEKDADGNDKIVYTLPEMVANVLDATQPGGEEEIYMTLMHEIFSGEYPEDGTEAVWEFLMAQKLRLELYGKATDAEGPKVVLNYELPLQCMPGDQESVNYMMTLTRNGKNYAVMSRYKESFFNPYYGMMDDITQRTENSLQIDLFEITPTSSKLVQQTFVPTPIDDEGYASFYSVGSLLYTDDVDFDHFNTDGKAAYIITRQDKTSMSDEYTVGSYFVVDPEGKVIKNLFEYAAAYMPMTDVKGQEPQINFIKLESSYYSYNFIDLYSGKTRASFSYLLEVEDGDPDRMTTNLDRAPWGDSYRYAVEMAMPTDDEGNSYMRVTWLDEQGKFIDTHEVNMGANIYYAQCFINGLALDPATFHTDDSMEYMVLVKRGNESGKIAEELLIGQPRSIDNPDGKTLLHLTPDERGVLNAINFYPGNAKNRLNVVYSNNLGYFLDSYDLPLDDPDGVTDIVAGPADSRIAINGNSVVADGYIEVYNAQGMLVAAGNDTVDLSALERGIFIARCDNATVKFIKK